MEALEASPSARGRDNPNRILSSGFLLPASLSKTGLSSILNPHRHPKPDQNPRPFSTFPTIPPSFRKIQNTSPGAYLERRTSLARISSPPLRGESRGAEGHRGLGSPFSLREQQLGRRRRVVLGGLPRPNFQERWGWRERGRARGGRKRERKMGGQWLGITSCPRQPVQGMVNSFWPSLQVSELLPSPPAPRKKTPHLTNQE